MNDHHLLSTLLLSGTVRGSGAAAAALTQHVSRQALQDQRVQFLSVCAAAAAAALLFLSTKLSFGEGSARRYFALCYAYQIRVDTSLLLLLLLSSC